MYIHLYALDIHDIWYQIYKYLINVLYNVHFRLLLIFQGTVLGKIEFDDQPIEFEDPNIRNLMAEVSTQVIWLVLYLSYLLKIYKITNLVFIYKSFNKKTVTGPDAKNGMGIYGGMNSEKLDLILTWMKIKSTCIRFIEQ